MAQPAEKTTIQDALEALRRDPRRPVLVRINDMAVELRAVKEHKDETPLGDFLASGGGWRGESAEDILEVLRESRKSGGSKVPPSGL
ncbi:MAG: hypothetical protein MJD61_07140 [Proteobacteria bacterium]|nr:hypothetical protein [Pseudomonadota bacterium]